MTGDCYHIDGAKLNGNGSGSFVTRNGGDMRFKIFFSCLSLAALGLPSLSVWGAEGIIYKAAVSANYCHLKFPAIREETLYTKSPVLKDSRDGDIVDFYGPCDHDPLGQEEVRRQKADIIRDQNRRTGDR
jgi:hypothetical protein